MSILDDLERRMNEAVEAGDFETADLLRGAIERIKTGESNLTEQAPGRMGLGTSQERYASEGAKVRMRKPDPMTKGHKPAGGKR